jgi:hypothetical protein
VLFSADSWALKLFGFQFSEHSSGGACTVSTRGFLSCCCVLEQHIPAVYLSSITVINLSSTIVIMTANPAASFADILAAE